MDLPIDARKAPFKQKYIDEETPMFARWIVFGTDANDGTRMIDCAQETIITGLTEQQAETLVMARTIFVETVLGVLNGVQHHRWTGKPLPAGESYGGAQVARDNPCADLPPTQLSPFRESKK